MSVPYSLSYREKATPLSDSQRQRLSEIIASKKILLDHSNSFSVLRKKQDAWDEVAVLFNSNYPADQPKTVTQLKLAWEYIRKRVKKNHSAFIRQSFKTGGGPPSQPVKGECMAMATGALSVELEFTENQLDSLATSEERGAPAAIPATAAPPTRAVTTTQAPTPAQAVATPVQIAPAATPTQAAPPAPTPTQIASAATPTQTAPAATPTQTAPAATPTQAAPPAQTAPAPTPTQIASAATPTQTASAATPTQTAPAATPAQTAPAATPTQAASTPTQTAPATTPTQAAAAATPTPGPSTRRGRKRAAGSEREECFRSIREGAETTNDELKLALRAFTDMCKKIGTKVVQTLDNVNTTLGYINNYYNSHTSE